MSMSTCVTFLRDNKDKEYQLKLKILLTCKEADIDPPKEVDEYFGGNGIDCDPEYPLEVKCSPRDWGDEFSEGFEIDVSEIPKGVKTIRFANS